MVGHDSSHPLMMFGKVCKPLSAELSEIWLIRPKFRSWVSSSTPQPLPVFHFSLIINYPVSYNVDKRV